MAHLKLPGILKRFATGRFSTRRTKRPVQNIPPHFTRQAKMALDQAKAQAQLNSSTGNEALFLLIAITGDATNLTAQFLADNGITPAFLNSALQTSPNPVKTPGPNPELYFQKITERAAATALRLNHPYIGTEHLLLGIFEEKKQISLICQPLTLNITELDEKFKILLQKPQFKPFAYK